MTAQKPAHIVTNFDGDDWLVVPHPIGNFTAVHAAAINQQPRPATPDDPAFYLLEEAMEYAESQPNVRFAGFHPSVLWVPYSRWGARWYRFKKRAIAAREGNQR